MILGFHDSATPDAGHLWPVVLALIQGGAVGKAMIPQLPRNPVG